MANGPTRPLDFDLLLCVGTETGKMLFIVCRSRSWAVYGVVVIRAEAGSLRPNEGVRGRSGVFLVVPGTERGRRGRTVPLIAAGKQQLSMIAFSVSNAVQV